MLEIPKFNHSPSLPVRCFSVKAKTGPRPFTLEKSISSSASTWATPSLVRLTFTFHQLTGADSLAHACGLFVSPTRTTVMTRNSPLNSLRMIPRIEVARCRWIVL